jgi:hypothetical protein
MDEINEKNYENLIFLLEISKKISDWLKIEENEVIFHLLSVKRIKIKV